ncbi:cytoplasm protein, putative [Cryptococcus deneoformans JEC21]|uniref:Cytoplasm protein, putative n=1 Tax=Cryptococcus deneoformans (strain JEC21 / ATCC MYA-565) TaxID=214684 RepID=Q5KLZ2_CRYD1|nr:cytoplasm protein, putative [Cryptococcus neoformans var. neoformans JEC21]AAW41882.1 cytoplasm protein, putative [Cryptococcus neoformans var. neoformans JEC21]
MTPSSSPKNIVVIGGGIAGVSTAYFLSTHPQRSSSTSITIVEGTKIAAAASGFSGGFLAKDWHGTSTSSLSEFSFDLHASLAEEFGGKEKWGYRTVETLSIETDATSMSKKASPLPWLRNGLVHSSRTLGSHTTTAQVHPRLFTTFFANKFLEQPSTSVVIGTVKSLNLEGGASKSIGIVSPEGDKTEIDADVVVIAAGPWTGRLAGQLLGEKIGSRLGVQGHRAHSIILKTKEELSATCLFTSMTLEDGSVGEPEVYTRPDGTTYICGAGDGVPLPPSAAEVSPSKSAIAKLHKQSQSLSPVFTLERGAEVISEQACYLPIADRGRPLIGKVRGVEGVYVGSGLSCWGITQGPGTGKVLSEMILEGKAKSADVSKLAP